MPECLPIIPGNCGVGQNADGSWHYERLHGVTPQGPAPWADRPATATITPADRLALVVCGATCPVGGLCPVEQICGDCRRQSAAVARELAKQAQSGLRYTTPSTDWAKGWKQGVSDTAQGFLAIAAELEASVQTVKEAQ